MQLCIYLCVRIHGGAAPSVGEHECVHMYACMMHMYTCWYVCVYYVYVCKLVCRCARMCRYVCVYYVWMCV